MINTLNDLVKAIFAILPFICLCLLSRGVNLDKPFRYRQFLMPIFAVAYVIIAMLLVESINNGVLKLIRDIPVWIASIKDISWMPTGVGNAADSLSGSIQSAIEGMNLKYWVFYISNALIVLAYMVYKKICISILNKIFSKNRLLIEKIASKFYEYFSEKDLWCLKDSYVQARQFSKVVYYTVLILSSVLMLISARMYGNSLLADMFYPVFGVILIGEIYFYLDGCNRTEYLRDILGEDEDSYKTVNYSLLRKYLRNMFGDKLLSESTNVNIGLDYDVTNEEIISKLVESEDPKIVSIATYYNKLNQEGFALDHNFLHSSIDLLNGKSILFNDPFYNDLIPYAFYPMNRTLLSKKKVLVVLGRHSIENDVINWIQDGIETVTNIPFLWKIGILNKEKSNIDIGIITRSDIIDVEIHNANSSFLSDVGYVVILEPSKLITTAQIGLNLLIRKCHENEENNIVFCMCDKNCDGLVDAMSHILMTNITEVSATKKHLGTCSHMCWEYDSDFIHHRLTPNISRYLGVGTELSFAALKNQVSETTWYGGEAFPVTDMSWIVHQYYYDLMKFASLPTNQDAINNYFHTSPNFWSALVRKNNYLTVEDESYNMYEILRDFSTRSTEQGFINVISPSYLLKDYMSDNYTIFETDAKAIPCIVADYARTDRNVIMKLLLLLCEDGITDKQIRKEFSLIGLPVLDTKKQIWFEIFRNLSSVDVVAKLPEDYNEASSKTMDMQFVAPGSGEVFHNTIINCEEKYNFKRGCMEMVYSITDRKFLASFMSKLKSAAYISEDEKGDKYYLGAELSEHIYQKLLPGQFFTYNGKYYEMQYVTTEGQVLVRRAADHIDGRPAYRQLRTYTLESEKSSNKIGSVQNVGGIRVTQGSADFSVQTEGYLKMSRYEDFETAKKVIFEGDNIGIPKRHYFNKSFIKIELPEIDNALTPTVRYTITVLINEVLKTLFADNYPYIVAVTDESFMEDENVKKPLTYKLINNSEDSDKNSIYIFEDSSLDMGLLVAFERNLTRIFQIIEDYLSWNKRAIAVSLHPPKTEKPLQIDNVQEKDEESKQKKEKFFKRIGKKISSFFKRLFRKIFRKKKKPIAEEESKIDDNDVPETDNIVEETIENNTSEEKSSDEVAEVTDTENATNDDNSVDTESNVDTDNISDTEEKTEVEPTQPNAPSDVEKKSSGSNKKEKNSPFDFSRTPYHKRYYLLFGGDSEPDSIDINGALSYLQKIDFGSNPLKEARRGKRIAKYVEETYIPNKKNARYCDFCGSEIFGVEYETLADGRDRCIACSRTAIKTEAEFIKVFEDVKRNFESFFGVKITTAIKVEMVNASKLNKSLGQAFIPTPNQDSRVLGVAINQHGTFVLRVENGSPRMMTMLTIAHELTHIWQYQNWNDKAIRKKYGKDLYLQIYEGMAKWVEIQYAYLINELSTAKREEIIAAHRKDEYGDGYIRYKANYPISTGTVITHDTPFMNVDTPLDPMYCGNDVTIFLAEDNSKRYDEELDDNNYDNFFDDDEFDFIEDNADDVETVKMRNPNSVKMFAYEQLSENEKDFYNRLLDAINSFELTVKKVPEWLNEKSLKKIFDFVLIDHPEIFWFEGKYTFYTDNSNQKITKLELKYCLTKKDSDIRKEEIQKAIVPFEKGINSSMSDYEVAKTIYHNIISIVDYDSVSLDKDNNTEEINTPDDLRSIYGVFVNHKAVCSGYSKATQYLMNKYGIECTLVTGASKKDDLHAWNLINLEGDYYYLDITWDDHSNTDLEKNTSKDVTYNYFCITTKELLKDHTIDTELNLPECIADKCNYFKRSGRAFDEYSFEKVRSLIKYDVSKGNNTVSVKFLKKSEYFKMLRDLITDKRLFEIIQYVNLDGDRRIKSNFTYVKDDEKFILTIYFDVI